MARRPRIAIVGAGNLGTALAAALRKRGYAVEIVARKRKASLQKAQAVAKRVGARVVNDFGGARADVIWFCVPDAEIAAAARSLAGAIEWRGKIALHSSGALSSDELGVLGWRGAAVGSVHPMMTFVRRSWPELAGVSFALEGDARAVRVARSVVKDLGGTAYSIRKQDKDAYHAWGTFASPLLTALLATTEQVAALAGVRRSAARRRMIPILRQTMANYAELGAARGFSGPIVRGDGDTVRRHLEVLGASPAARAVYVQLARAAVRYLPGKNRRLLRRILESG